MQDEYLRQETAEKGVADLADLSPISEGIYLWQGGITTLRCDAIVNATNSGMTGCYVPCHSCIDNCIHTYAGVQHRLECARLMAEQGHEEETGMAKTTSAYNLPCKYVLHTIGHIVQKREKQFIEQFRVFRFQLNFHTSMAAESFQLAAKTNLSDTAPRLTR